MNKPPVERLELRPRLQQQTAQQYKHMVWVVLVLLTLIPFLYIVPLLKKRAGDEANWEAVWGILWKRIEADPLHYGLNALLLCLLLIQVVFLLSVQKRERLILTRSGIEYHSPLPPWLQFVRSSWTVSWSQVRALSLRPSLAGQGLQGVVLELETGTGKRTLTPFYWIDPENYQPVPPLKLAMQLRRYSAEGQAEYIDASPLIQYVQAVLPNMPVKRAANLFNASFAIEKNPSSLAVTSVFLLLLVYAILDGGFLGHETYAQDPPYILFAAVGAVVAIAGWFWMMRGKVPVAEGLMIALLTGCGAGMAAYPGALRLNAMTDREGIQTYQYTMAAGREFQPLVAGPPVLHFDKYEEYWSQFKAGSEYGFELRRGGLGFFQLNMEPIEHEMREFYIKSRQK